MIIKTMNKLTSKNFWLKVLFVTLLMLLGHQIYINYFFEPKLFHWNIPLSIGFLLLHRWGAWLIPVFFINKIIWPTIISSSWTATWFLHAIPETITLIISWLLIKLLFKSKTDKRNTAALSTFLMVGIVIPLILSALFFELIQHFYLSKISFDLFLDVRFKLSRDAISIIALSLPLLIYYKSNEKQLFFSTFQPLTLFFLGVVCLSGVFLIYPQDRWWFYALILALVSSTSGIGHVLTFNLLTIISIFTYNKIHPSVLINEYGTVADIHLGISALIFISLLISRSISDSRLQWSIRKDFEQRNKIFIDSNPDVLLMLNKDGIIIDYRDNSKIKHLDFENITGHPFTKFYDREVVNLIQNAMQTSKLKQHATFIFSQNLQKNMHHFEAKTVYYDPNYLIFIRDISTIRNAEKQKQVLYQELKNRNEEMEKFTYTVSHDLKSPLITIRGFLDMAQEELQNKEFDEISNYLQRVDNAALKMGNMLNDLLQLSRTGTIKSANKWMKLHDIIQDTCEMLAMSIKQNGVEIINKTQGIEVYVDEARILELFQNLIENAIKYRNNEIKPRIVCTAKTQDGKLICAISDNGIGLQDYNLQNIFTIFHKLDKDSEGTGLGLALAKRIVENHGGSIWAESKGLNLGSTFYIDLPNYRVHRK